MVMFMLMIVLIALLMLTLPQLYSFNMDKNMKSSIEAGFSSLGQSSQTSFSMQFIIVMLIFITFDLELLFISSVIVNFSTLLSLTFCIFIILTLMLELVMGSLKWLS